MSDLLSIAEVREFVSDYAPNNYLIEGEEFTDAFIHLCRDLSIDEWNTIPPFSKVTLSTFPSKSALLYGTLWKMFDGRAALLARNTMSYSDAGVSIAIEERSELYRGLASGFRDSFQSSAKSLKQHLNLEEGWGSVSSEYATFPLW